LRCCRRSGKSYQTALKIMRAKNYFLVILIFLACLLPFILFHKSSNPVFFRWSPNYLLFIVLYLGLAILTLFSYLTVDRQGLKFCIYLYGVYIVTFLVIDFILGTRYYYAHLFYVKHPVYDHVTVPGAQKWGLSDQRFLDGSYTVHINSQRLRSAVETAIKKPDNYYRILVLGDSFTFGVGVEDSQTFCYLLQEYLNKSSRDNKVKYEVLNSGVPSYVPLIEYLYLKNEGVKFNPDLVILFLDMSDLIQTQYYLKNAVKDKKGEITRVTPQKPYHFGAVVHLVRKIKSRFYYLYKPISIIENIIWKDVEMAFNEHDAGLFKFTLSADQAQWKGQWQDIYAHIDLISAFCKKEGINFLVVTYPYGHQVNNYESNKIRRHFGIPENYTAPPDVFYMLERAFSEKGICVLDLLTVFKEYKGKAPLYFSADIHWTKYGHKLVAVSLFNFLKNNLKNNKLNALKDG